jgi:hypothetical protein
VGAVGTGADADGGSGAETTAVTAAVSRGAGSSVPAGDGAPPGTSFGPNASLKKIIRKIVTTTTAIAYLPRETEANRSLASVVLARTFGGGVDDTPFDSCAPAVLGAA